MKDCTSCNGTGIIRVREAFSYEGKSYYVWRMAHFHGGADYTMPVMASVEIHGDPWRAELDAIADATLLRSPLRCA